MSLQVKAAAARAFQEFRTDFIKTSEETPRLHPEYAVEVPSRAKSTLHGWLTNQAKVRKWNGGRIARNMSTRTWEVFNEKWELTYEFDRDQLEDDLEGLVDSAVMEARNSGKKFARHEDLIIAQALEAGVSSACWDGQYFFDTDHPVDVDGVGSSATYDNDLTLALTHANMNTALVSMLNRKHEDGSPMVLSDGLMLMVPTALRMTAQQIVETDTLTPGAAYGLFGTGGASKNPLAGAARIIVNPYLADTTRWYLLASDGIIKPLMFQRRRGLETSELGEGSELYFNEEKFQIGGSARYTASYTMPYLALTSKP